MATAALSRMARASVSEGRSRRAATIASFVILALVCSGCMLNSGHLRSADTRPDAGNTSASFLSAEGEELYTLPVGPTYSSYEVITIVAVEQGELEIELYDASGAPAMTVQGRPDQQVTRSGRLASDERGTIRYRVRARGARNGSYQILYRQIP